MPDTETYLVSFSGEIGIKAPATRRALEELTLKSFLTRAGVLGLSPKVEPFWGRILLSGPRDLERLLATQAGFGRWGYFRETWDPTLLPERPFTYVVYVDRVEPRESFSEALAQKRALLELLEKEARRNLSSWDNYPPERLEIRLEVRRWRLFYLINPRPALGGFPPGASGRGLVLFSGGPDSLLATLFLLRRGLLPALIFFDDGEAGRAEAVQELVREVAFFFPEMAVEFFQVEFREALEFIASRVATRERCFFCKAAMLRLAGEILSQEGFSVVATGEILGEQASQTLPALLFTARAAGVPLLRPLLGLNKEEVFERLSALGLKEAAFRRLPACPWAPDHPHTLPRSRPETLGSLWPAIRKRVKKIERKILSRKG
ncbi:hypothetical protein [Thermosulfurimonas marina]|uniref:hypothetical protein n=1 Tax=Thermosulfurimonas marina TaxID=2047767 RepID=UPI00144A9615|nr:hypothetical protein [Thermosulfurimonas marina]